ncbi:B-type lectin plumieribetin-like [Symphorus nematophorus]
MSRNYLTKDDELRKGDYLMSNNREWKAVFQNDSNFVIYGWKPVWASDTWNADALRLIMQGDSNLVMYNSCGQPKWSTGTYVRGECEACHLQLTDDGKLVLHRGAQEVWNSDNSKGKKE